MCDEEISLFTPHNGIFCTDKRVGADLSDVVETGGRSAEKRSSANCHSTAETYS